MKYLKSQSELLFESLLSESLVYYSPVLRNKLIHMGKSNTIAKKLVDTEGKYIKSDLTFIDIGEEGYFSFIQMDKAMKMIKDVYPRASDAKIDQYFDTDTSDILYRYDVSGAVHRSEIYIKSRNQIRIGKAVKKLLSGKYSDFEIEEFVNLFKSTQVKPGDISIVSGYDIIEWYKIKNYYSSAGSTLVNSCMNDSEYMKLYSNNPEVCKLLIMTVGGKLVARSLVWELSSSNIPGDPKFFMDRVYYINDKELSYMKEFARDQGWSYRSYNGHSHLDEVTYNNQKYKDIKMTVKVKPAFYKKYPYLDTFKKYLPESGILLNNDCKDNGILLNRTDGTYGKTINKTGILQRLMNRFKSIPTID